MLSISTSEEILIERIFPKASELSEILNYVHCPECTMVFHNTPNLEMHLSKCHGHDTGQPEKAETKNRVAKQFYCPVDSCKYSGALNRDKAMRYFTQHKYLKQHYLKVHMEKKFICDRCKKGFTTEQHRQRHQTECGTKFVCSCGAEYTSAPALLTHAARKGHTFVKSWSTVRGRKADGKRQPLDKSVCDASVQTEPAKRRRVNPPARRQKKPNHAETQTLEMDSVCSSKDTLLSRANQFTDMDSDSTDQFLSELLASDDRQSLSCSTETQTVDWEQCCHNYTQTCGDFSAELLGFSDTQTQTTWPDL